MVKKIKEIKSRAEGGPGKMAQISQTNIQELKVTNSELTPKGSLIDGILSRKAEKENIEKRFAEGKAILDKMGIKVEKSSSADKQDILNNAFFNFVFCFGKNAAIPFSATDLKNFDNQIGLNELDIMAFELNSIMDICVEIMPILFESYYKAISLHYDLISPPPKKNY